MPSYLCLGINIRCRTFGHSPQTGEAIERSSIDTFCDQSLQGGKAEGKRECGGHKQPGDAFLKSSFSREGQADRRVVVPTDD